MMLFSFVHMPIAAKVHHFDFISKPLLLLFIFGFILNINTTIKTISDGITDCLNSPLIALRYNSSGKRDYLNIFFSRVAPFAESSTT